MYQIILFFHVMVAAMLVGLVLIQQGKGAAAGAAFGSGASQTMFGSRGSGSFLFRVTLSFLALFFITSIALNNLAVRATRQQRVITVPAVPVTPTREAPMPAPVVDDSLSKKSTAPSDNIPARQ